MVASTPPLHDTAIAPVIKITKKASAVPAISTTSTIDNNSNMVTSKPSRPYTEYTMFYQLEREYIIHRILNEDPSGMSPSSIQPALFQNDPLMPARYRLLPLRADWYISGKTKKPTKRKHRKSHGKIGFLELTRMIAARWASVDDETRKYCKMMAAMELVKYKEDMDSYNKYKEQLSKVGEIPEDMKQRMLKKRKAAEKKDASATAARVEKGSDTPTPPPPPPVIKADTIHSNQGVLSTNTAIKIEPLALDSPIQRVSSNNFDDMEQFISSLVQSPKASPRKSTTTSTRTTTSTSSKVVTPDRSPKKRRLFRDKSTVTTKSSKTTTTTTAAASLVPAIRSIESKFVDEILVPLKSDTNDVDHLDGIKMLFSGIDENEIALEFPDHVHPLRSPAASSAAESGAPVGRSTSSRMMALTPASAIRDTKEISFDYWDALVERHF
jgi:hypothetical protein